MSAPLAPALDRPWVALIDKAGPHGRHGRAARARALASAFSDLGHEAVHFQALRGDKERTGVAGGIAAGILGAAHIARDVRAEARRRGRAPAVAIVSNAQLAWVARRLRSWGWNVWAELHLLEWNFGYAPPLGWLLARAERSLVHAAQRTVCLSVTDAVQVARMHGLPGDHVHVLPHTVEAHWLEPATPLRPSRRLVFVGSWHHPPNREAARFLVDRLMPLLRTAGGWRLALVGNGFPDTFALADVEVHADVADPRDEVDAAAACLAPLWMGGGVRTKVLEAMGRARPVVATAIAMEGIAATPGEHFLQAATPEEFAAALERLSSDPAFARRVGEQGRHLVASSHSPEALRAGLRPLLTSLTVAQPGFGT